MDGGQRKIENGPPVSPDTTYRYVDMVEIADWFGITHRAVANWRTRYADTHPFPEPDVIIGRTPGWSRERKSEIEAWAAGRPGQGAGGGRPSKPA